MSLVITIDTSDCDAFFAAFPAKFKVGVEEGFSQLGDQIVNTTTGLAPVDTGYMQSQIKVDKGDDNLIATAGASYSSYVDEGTFKMSAQPFFTDPINTIANDIPNIMSKTIDRSVGITG